MMMMTMIKSNYFLPSASRIAKLSSFTSSDSYSCYAAASSCEPLFTTRKNLCGSLSHYHHQCSSPHSHHLYFSVRNYLTGNLASTTAKFTDASTRTRSDGCIVGGGGSGDDGDSSVRSTTTPPPPRSSSSSLVADNNNNDTVVTTTAETGLLPIEIATDSWNTAVVTAAFVTDASASIIAHHHHHRDYDGSANIINNKWSASETKTRCCTSGRQQQLSELLKHNQIGNNSATLILMLLPQICLVRTTAESKILSLANLFVTVPTSLATLPTESSSSICAKSFAYLNHSAANGLNKLMTMSSTLSMNAIKQQPSLAASRMLHTATASGTTIGNWHFSTGGSHVNHSIERRTKIMLINKTICQSRLLLSTNRLAQLGTAMMPLKEQMRHQQYPISIDDASRSFSSLFGGASDDQNGGGGQDRYCWRCDKPINVSKSMSEHQKEEQQQQQHKPEQEKVGPEKQKVAVCEHCGSIQPISSDVNLFTLFNLRLLYDVDQAALRQQYLRLQQNMHPDMNINRSNTESGYSLDNSSIINSAYKTLRDPYQRALYMLKICYNITIDEGNIETEPELLLEIMELNEDIEEASGDKQCLMDLQQRLQESIDSIVANLKVAFDIDNNGCEARKLTVRFVYYQTALDKLRTQLVNV